MSERVLAWVWVQIPQSSANIEIFNAVYAQLIIIIISSSSSSKELIYVA